MEPEEVGIGVVGCGDIARKAYLPAIVKLAKDQKARLVAVCDIDQARLADAKKQYGAKRSYADLSELLEDDEVQLVVDLVPGPQHAAVNLASVLAGKHVYSEKPFVNELEAGREIIRTARDRGVLLGCAPSVMLDETNIRIRKLLADGALGKVYFAIAKRASPGPARMDFWPVDPTWFYKKGTGPLRDVGVYALTTLTGILGPAKRVSALSGLACPEVLIKAKVRAGEKLTVEEDDNTGLMLDFGEAVFGFLFAGFGVQWLSDTHSLEVYGTNGNVYVSAKNELHTVLEGRGPETTHPHKDKPWNVADGLPHLVECLRTGSGAVLNPEHALHVVEIVEKAYLSARSGTTLELETTFDDSTAPV